MSVCALVLVLKVDPSSIILRGNEHTYVVPATPAGILRIALRK